MKELTDKEYKIKRLAKELFDKHYGSDYNGESHCLRKRKSRRKKTK